jgi:hypothetical protein
VSTSGPCDEDLTVDGKQRRGFSLARVLARNLARAALVRWTAKLRRCSEEKKSRTVFYAMRGI